MAHYNIDLCDGKPPVTFSLNERDGERFQAFMAECQELRRSDPNYEEGVTYRDPMEDDEDD